MAAACAAPARRRARVPCARRAAARRRPAAPARRPGAPARRLAATESSTGRPPRTSSARAAASAAGSVGSANAAARRTSCRRCTRRVAAVTSPSVPRAPTMTCMRSGPVALRGASRVAISVPSGSSAWMPTQRLHEAARPAARPPTGAARRAGHRACACATTAGSSPSVMPRSPSCRSSTSKVMPACADTRSEVSSRCRTLHMRDRSTSMPSWLPAPRPTPTRTPSSPAMRTTSHSSAGAPGRTSARPDCDSTCWAPTACASRSAQNGASSLTAAPCRCTRSNKSIRGPPGLAHVRSLTLAHSPIFPGFMTPCGSRTSLSAR